jgi:MerR family transcriptional regulator, copper efflux regulator
VASRVLASSASAPASAGRLTIGQVARRTGFSVKALRFYERRGLLPPAGRSAGGFRLYAEADIHRLDFVRQAKSLGLSLEQIRELVLAARQQDCGMTRPRLLRILDERIRQTAEQIGRLTDLKSELEQQRRTLARRSPTEHGRGYCKCFSSRG